MRTCRFGGEHRSVRTKRIGVPCVFVEPGGEVVEVVVVFGRHSAVDVDFIRANANAGAYIGTAQQVARAGNRVDLTKLLSEYNDLT